MKEASKQNEPRAGAAGPSRLPLNVLALGLVSLLTDASSEMIVPLLPAFLAGLGAGAFALGWVEGLADLVASLLKLVSGRLSDRHGRRRPLVLAGYGLSTLARPLVAFAAAAWHVIAIRCLDRVGKGLRGSPRDALLAHSVSPERRGAAFGFHRAMDHAGATLGPLLAIALLGWAGLELRTLFLWALLPGLGSVLVILFLVREVEAPGAGGDPPRASSPARALPTFLLPLALFTLGKASDLFLMQVLADTSARPSGAAFDRHALVQFSSVWIGIHVVKMLASYPGGWLGDRLGRRRVVLGGWLLHALACLGLASASSRPALLALCALWGLQDGLSEGPQKALVSSLAPKRGQGSAFGWYHLTIGLCSFAASVLFGALYQHHGPRTAFLTSAALSLTASAALWSWARRSAPASA